MESAEAGRRILAPIGAQAHRWRTFGPERTLVVAARTVTSLVRALDVVPDVVADDPRVAVVFAYDPSSAFEDGVLDLLRRLRCRTMPWAQLHEVEVDLLLSASENVDPPGDFPVLVLPHGVGFQKWVPDSENPGTRLSGLARDSLLAARRAWLTVSHPQQARQAEEASPSTAGRTVLVGDPCFDRLTASSRWRERYRERLGVLPDQRLVLLSSTWGPGALIARHPRLPAELLARLPLDGYRVALVLHPNVWSVHGAWQIEVMLRSAIAAGLHVVDPTDGWQQAVIASDLLIGDHGSVTLYGAAVGRPVLLGAFGPEAVPGTAGETLRRVAAGFDAGAPARPQVEAAIAGHRPDRYAEVADQAFAVPGEAMTRLRRLVYELLRLAPAETPVRGVQAFPLPPAATARPTAMFVETTVDGSGDRLGVDVRRYPLPVAEESSESEQVFWHLACDVGEPDTRLVESATALLSERPADGLSAGVRLARGMLADFPGARLAALPFEGGCLVGLRDGRVLEVTAARAEGGPAAAGAGRAPGPAVAAALVYACLRAGEPLGHRTVLLRHGKTVREVGLRPLPQEAAQSPGADSPSRARSSAARGFPPAS